MLYFEMRRIQNYEASASGGNDRTTFRIGSSFTTQQAILSKADFNRGTLKLDLTNKATDKLSITTSLNLSTAKQTIPFSVDGSSLGSPAFSASLFYLLTRYIRRTGRMQGYRQKILPARLTKTSLRLMNITPVTTAQTRRWETFHLITSLLTGFHSVLFMV
jgi:hypothetical protein